MSDIYLSGKTSTADSHHIDIKSENTINFINNTSDLSITFNAMNPTNFKGYQNTSRFITGRDNQSSPLHKICHISVYKPIIHLIIYGMIHYYGGNKIGVNTNQPGEALSINGNIEVLNGNIRIGNSKL